MAAPKKAVGPKSDKIWRDAVMRAVRRVSADGHTQHLEKLADQLVAKAASGDIPALKEIGDRLDGRPAQVTVLEDPEGKNPFDAIKVHFVGKLP